MDVALSAVSQLYGVVSSSVVGHTVAPSGSIAAGCCPTPRACTPSSFFALAVTLTGNLAEPFWHTKSGEKQTCPKESSFLPG